MMPDWLTPFFNYFPAYALFFLGVGVPWALALLPREEWRNPTMLFATAFALGPLFSTTWMFVLGTWGTFKIERVLTGILMLAVVGTTAAWLRRYTPYRQERTRSDSWTSIEIALLGMLVIGFILHIWITLYWPFVQYDTLWTFGYNPRVFLLQERIPDWIDYYPQLVPLTYTYGQLFEGTFNDHVARAAVPWFFMGSGWMAYLLGRRVWGKRAIGILTAALWMLMPHALYWSSAGDLEHPVTLYFTGAVVFFVLAWRSHHWRYALLSGLMFAGAAWTKPTAGSFALGVILVVLLSGSRFFLIEKTPINIPSSVPVPMQLFRQKFLVAAIIGLASLPIGLMWYIRNSILEHDLITFPENYWNDFAQRSGQEFGWLILIAFLAVSMVTHQAWSQLKTGAKEIRRQIFWLWLGLALFLLGTLPNALNTNLAWQSDSLWKWVNGARPAAGRLNGVELGLIIVGLSLIVWQIRPAWLKTTDRAKSSIKLTVALIAPFTIIWFLFYSYHYRLMLTITPVFASMTAALLDAWLLPLAQKNRLRKRVSALLAVLLCLPGIAVAGWFTAWHTLVAPLENDRAKYEATNPALMEVVEVMEQTLQTKPRNFLNVYTMGENRLNFFFPHMRTLWDDQRITTLNEMYQSTDLFIGGATADFLWQFDGKFPNQISAYMQMGYVYSSPTLEFKTGNIWQLPLRPMKEIDDGNNRFVVYEVYYPNRFRSLEEVAPPVLFEDIHWDFIALRGMDIRSSIPNDTESLPRDENGAFPLHAGQEIYLQFYWQRPDETPIPYDYSILVYLVNQDTGEILSQRDGGIADNTLPLTLIPAHDLIPDRRFWKLPDDLPAGRYDLHIGFYDANNLSAPRLPVYEDENPLGDVFIIENIIQIE